MVPWIDSDRLGSTRIGSDRIGSARIDSSIRPPAPSPSLERRFGAELLPRRLGVGGDDGGEALMGEKR